MKALRFVALCMIAAACGRDEISVRREAKSEDAAPTSAAPAAAPAGLRWTAPAGWVETAGGNMRVAAFRLPPPSEAAEATVATFPGDVGGELANVNRWRGQIALPPIGEGELAALRTTVSSAAGPVTVYDFTASGERRSRLVAGMVRTGDSTWFFKLTGPEAAVASARQAFLGLLKGLRRDAL